jgi:AcrR family transcriptional regulator/GNAT superfamily N-acetyltransferase
VVTLDLVGAGRATRQRRTSPEASASRRPDEEDSVTDDELRQRIVDVAAELFAERGYGGTRLRMVAERAGVPSRTVKQLTGSRAQLFALVLATRPAPESAVRVAAAAADPEAAPPVSVLLEAAGDAFSTPGQSWNVVELEALTRAHTDADVRALETDRLQTRKANLKQVTQQTRRAGGIDDRVDDDAFVHFALALSAGLAVIDPVTENRPSQASWNALMARLGAAFAPPGFLLAAEHEAPTPWRLRIDVPDRPGALSQLLSALGTLHVYVVATSVLDSRDGTRTVDLALMAPEQVSAETLLASAMSVGSHGYVMAGSPDDGTDLPTRVLDGATELVTNPGSAPLAAATLVEADSFEVTDATQGADDAADVLRLQWTADRHVVLHRNWAPFARAEKTRASALLRLASAMASMAGEEEALGWVEPMKSGGTVWIRLARPEDSDAVAAMHERCSEQTLYRRYLTGVGTWRDVSLRRLSGGHRGATLVAMSEEGAIVGLGHVFPDSTTDGHAAEIAVIVEDAYQRRGIGTRLVRHMLELAERLGFDEVVGTVLAQNDEMLRVLDATRLAWERHVEEGVLTLRAPLPPVAPGATSAGRGPTPGSSG